MNLFLFIATYGEGTILTKVECASYPPMERKGLFERRLTFSKQDARNAHFR